MSNVDKDGIIREDIWDNVKRYLSEFEIKRVEGLYTNKYHDYILGKSQDERNITIRNYMGFGVERSYYEENKEELFSELGANIAIANVKYGIVGHCVKAMAVHLDTISLLISYPIFDETAIRKHGQWEEFNDDILFFKPGEVPAKYRGGEK